MLLLLTTPLARHEFAIVQYKRQIVAIYSPEVRVSVEVQSTQTLIVQVQIQVQMRACALIDKLCTPTVVPSARLYSRTWVPRYSSGGLTEPSFIVYLDAR